MQEKQNPPARPRRRVIWSVTPDQSPSPYIADIVRGLRQDGWTIESLSLRDLATTTGEIVHIQWPEHVSRGPSPAKTAAKHVRALGLLAAIKLGKHRVVVTAHNISPHGDYDAFDAWFRDQILGLAEVMVVLVPAHEQELRLLGQVHPTLRVVTSRQPVVPEPRNVAESEHASTQSTSLLVLGQIHPYHRIQEFIEALVFLGNTRPVEVVGSVGDEELVADLERQAKTIEWLTVSPGYISDEELGPLIARTIAVVSLQRTAFNSGGPFFAFARELPVILSVGAQAKLLAEEVGNTWVFEVPADERTLDLDALNTWLESDRPSPVLDRYTVSAVAAEHTAIYELLLGDT